MSAGRKSSAEAGSFLVVLMALKICLLQLVMHLSLSRGTLFESISMISGIDKDRNRGQGLERLMYHLSFLRNRVKDSPALAAQM